MNGFNLIMKKNIIIIIINLRNKKYYIINY